MTTRFKSNFNLIYQIFRMLPFYKKNKVWGREGFSEFRLGGEGWRARGYKFCQFSIKYRDHATLFQAKYTTNIYFELKLQAFVMTKAVSNREICFIKAVLLLCEQGTFQLFFASHGFFCPPPHPHTIRVKKSGLG